MTKKSIEGGCHCGAVRYTLTAKPYSSMICHCRTCRGVSGGPVLAWVSVARDGFAFSMGHPKEYVSSDGVLRMGAKGSIANDAGIARNNTAVEGVSLLAEKGVPSAAVSTMSARLG